MAMMASSVLLSEISSIETLRSQSSHELPEFMISKINKIRESIGCVSSVSTPATTPFSRTPVPDNTDWTEVRSRRIKTPYDENSNGSGGSSPSPVPKMKLPSEHGRYYPRYVSKFKSEEKVDDTIINTIIRGKLNKFNASNYNEIRDFLCQILDSGESDFLKQFMLFVFSKSTEEEIFCPLYVRLLSELCTKYTIIQGEMKLLFEEYLNMFKEKNTNQNSSDDQYENFLKKTGNKKHRLGYSQFLTELATNDIIEYSMFNRNISVICSEIERLCIDEQNTDTINEYIECVMKMFKTLSVSSSRTCIQIKAELKALLSFWENYTIKNPTFKGISSRTRFTCMDICDICRKM